jgi:cation:H+ antiporter
MSILLWFAAFCVSLAVLIKSSDYFTNSAEKLGFFFNLPPFIIGVTIVAIGTSLPELASSLAAVFSNKTEIVVANVVGSNIANIFLVLGIAALFAKKIKIKYDIIKVDLPILASSAFLLYFFALDSRITMAESIILLTALMIYITYTIKDHSSFNELNELEKDKNKINGLFNILKEFFILIISGLFIYLGAKYTIDSVVELSKLLNVGVDLISLSAIALGTSLPELIVTITAAKKRKAEIAVGNVLGSNIFNTFAVIGIPGLFKNLEITKEIKELAIPFMIIATLLYLFITQDKEVSIWEGLFLILFYLVFLLMSFGFL